MPGLGAGICLAGPQHVSKLGVLVEKILFAPQGGSTLGKALFLLKRLKNGTFELISSKPVIKIFLWHASKCAPK